MEVFLQGLLPRLFPNLVFQIFTFKGKHDMLAKLPQRLAGYSRSISSYTNLFIVVVIDQDRDDCRLLKRRLEEFAGQTGLATRSQPSGGCYTVVNRIAMEELEAWYFGDWDAVRQAYRGVTPTIPNKPAYINPDTIKGGTAEAFERLMKRAGYFRSGLRKVEAARSIAPHVDPQRSRSHSFRVFIEALREIAGVSDQPLLP